MVLKGFFRERDGRFVLSGLVKLDLAMWMFFMRNEKRIVALEEAHVPHGFYAD